jgi:hypothetical protein
MVPQDKNDLAPELNAYQTLIAIKQENEWRIELFQNIPSQFLGRPYLVEKMTNKLKLELT